MKNTVETVIDDLLQQLSEEQKEEIKNAEIYEMHFNLGMYIRNAYQPYVGRNDDLILSCIKHDIEDYNEDVDYGFLMTKYAGDDCSSVILRELRKRLNQVK
jgi:hypothetical protein